MDKFIKDGSLFNRPDHKFEGMLSLLEKGSVVYDLGAYIGTFSIPFAIEGMDVYAFEAWPENHIRCREHTKPYGVTNFCVALSDKNKTEKGQITHCKGWANHDRELFEEIKYIRLDDFIAEHHLPLPAFVKMDIEGMESIAMHGMTNLLEHVRPIWSVGYHFKMPVEVEGIAWVEVEDGGFDFNKIGELDYLIFDSMSGKQMPNNILQTSGGEYLFIPKEKMHEV
jgi:FkbM family methyltransferase